MNSEFEWDGDKADSNYEKHGVSFDFAIGIFEGDRIEVEDRRQDYGEKRIIALGAIEGEILIVIYTRRHGRIRIISARRAGRNDREKYHQTFPERS